MTVFKIVFLINRLYQHFLMKVRPLICRKFYKKSSAAFVVIFLQALNIFLINAVSARHVSKHHFPIIRTGIYL